MIDAVAASIALYAISLAENVRQLPPDAMVLRRFGRGRWAVARDGQLGHGLRLLSWCAPLSMPLVLHPGASASPAELRRHVRLMQARMRRSRRAVAMLRALGVATVVVLVGVLPYAAATHGIVGLGAAIGALVLLAIVQAIAAARVLVRNGAAMRSALMHCCRLLNPFAAPRAAELAHASNVGGVPALAAACELVGAEALVPALRPAIFDTVHDHTRDAAVESLIALVGTDRLRALLRTPPPACGDDSFCPRCGAAFISTVQECADCRGIMLLSACEPELARS